jgi:hypothetical protein
MIKYIFKTTIDIERDAKVDQATRFAAVNDTATALVPKVSTADKPIEHGPMRIEVTTLQDILLGAKMSINYVEMWRLIKQRKEFQRDNNGNLVIDGEGNPIPTGQEETYKEPQERIMIKYSQFAPSEYIDPLINQKLDAMDSGVVGYENRMIQAVSQVILDDIEAHGTLNLQPGQIVFESAEKLG